MARSIEEIKQQLIDTKDSLSALSGLTSNSQVAVYNNIFHTVAVEISILEQLIDSYIAQIETIINAQAIGTPPWLRAKILEFQYGDYVELDTTDFSIAYPEVNEALKIITRCSVTEAGNLVVQAKVAKSDPPVALSGAEVTALEDYLEVISPVGTQINVISLSSDKLYIEGTVYYSGQYSSVISTNVEAALSSYMENLSSSENFDGIVKATDVVDAIRTVEGVEDVQIEEISARPNLTVFASRTVIFSLSSSVNIREYTTASGYIVEETESGETFTDKIAYVAV